MKTRASLFLVVTLMVVLAIGLWSDSNVFAKEPYKIGALFSVTGRASFLGEPERNTAKMIEKMVNEKGGINGHPLEVIVYDTEGKEDRTVLAVKKLIKKDKVLAIIGPSTSGTSLSIIPIVNQFKLPLISCGASKKIGAPVEKRKWVFKVVADDDSAVQLIYDHMKSRGINRIAILTVSTGYGISGREELRRLAPKNGIQIVADETYGPKDTDMTAHLTKIRGTEAQAFVNWSIGTPQVIVTRNWKQLGLKLPLYQSYGFGSKRNIKLAEGAAEGVICPVTRIVVADKLKPGDPQYSVVREYKKLYEEKFSSNVSVFGGHAWDSLYQIIDALKEVGPDREKIRTYLENLKDFVGQNGIFNRSAKDHVGLTQDAYLMVEVKNSDWKILQY